MGEFHGSEEVVISKWPLDVGTRIKYYNHERIQEVEAIVRNGGMFFLWVVDVNEPPPGGSRDHYIVRQDITAIMDVPGEPGTIPGNQHPHRHVFQCYQERARARDRETKTAKMGHFILVCAWLGKVCCSPWTRARGACFTTLAPPDSLFLLVGTVTVVRKICLYS